MISVVVYCPCMFSSRSSRQTLVRLCITRSERRRLDSWRILVSCSLNDTILILLLLSSSKQSSCSSRTRRLGAVTSSTLRSFADSSSNLSSVSERMASWANPLMEEISSSRVTTRVFEEAKNTNFLKFFLQCVKHVDARSN